MLLEVNLTMILFAISFLVFIYLLNFTLYKPVGKIVEDRKNLIEGSYEKSKEYASDASKIFETYEKKIKEARQEAKKIIEDIIYVAKAEKAERVSSLVKTLVKEKEQAVVEIQKELQIKKEALQSKIHELKDLITEKILGGDLVGTH